MKITIIGEHWKDWELSEITGFLIGFNYAIFKMTLGEKFCCDFVDYETCNKSYNHD